MNLDCKSFHLGCEGLHCLVFSLTYYRDEIWELFSFLSPIVVLVNGIMLLFSVTSEVLSSW